MSDRINLGYNTYYENGVLDHGHNAGFFSNLSTCLWSAVSLYHRHSGVAPARIRCARSFNHYKRAEDRDVADIYPHHFAQNADVPLGPIVSPAPKMNHHSLYTSRVFSFLRPMVERYFIPNSNIDRIRTLITKKYCITPENTIGVWYRGTDKSKEIHNASTEYYLKHVLWMLKREPHLRVWLQSDQEQAVDLFRAELCHSHEKLLDFVDMLPVTRGSGGIHLQNDNYYQSCGLTREAYGQLMLATVSLMSKCRYVVACTGNVGYWLMLYREHWAGCYQDVNHYRLRNGGPEDVFRPVSGDM